MTEPGPFLASLHKTEESIFLPTSRHPPPNASRTPMIDRDETIANRVESIGQIAHTTQRSIDATTDIAIRRGSLGPKGTSIGTSLHDHEKRDLEGEQESRKNDDEV